MAQQTESSERPASTRRFYSSTLEGEWTAARQYELEEIRRHTDAVPQKIRDAISLFRILLVGIAIGCLLMSMCLAGYSLINHQPGIAMLLAVAVVMFMPLVGFATFRVFHPLWLVKKAAAALRDREEQLLASREFHHLTESERDADRSTNPISRLSLSHAGVELADQAAIITDAVAEQAEHHAGVTMRATDTPSDHRAETIGQAFARRKAEAAARKARSKQESDAQSWRAPHWWTADGKRAETPRGARPPGLPSKLVVFGVLSTMAIFMVLFAAGIVVGVLTAT